MTTRRPASRLLKSVTQRMLFTLEQFSRDEMANHASAGAYSFLLSAVPAVLVIVYLSSLAAISFDTDELLGLLGPYLGAFGGKEATRAFVSKPLSGFAGAFGLVNLVWAARLFVVSIQRGFRVIWSKAVKVNPVRENILTFAVELVTIVAIVAIIAVSQIARATISAIEWEPAAALAGFTVRVSVRMVPALALWLFVALTYRTMPPKRPRPTHAIVTSALCVASYTALGALLGLTMNADRYGLLYGILGNLIVGLIKVYFFFWLYFFFAELTYTIEFFDSLLFARFHRLDSSEKPAGKIERTLFSEPARLFRRYAREYSAGQTIFSRGDDDRSALYLYHGSVEIHLAPPGGIRSAPMSRVDEGEFFGEMAWILEEPRSAWAVAATDCTVFVLPSALFERFLAHDAGASRRLVEILAARLKANNEFLSKTRPR
ncbi:MAG: hypothetical protein CVV51_00695 [Spirochaetae bacterium HGW-Spirochaetae-7]|nr:MAG: hypothetical protein CVV51_00695 [Spirochaetae bacterium HGW-Spirochaetae-7]